MAQKILIVEDDPFLSSLLKTRLTKEGFEVVRAADGEQALAMLKEQKPNLMLLDLILPKKSGFEVLEAARADAETKSLPVIIISNLGQDDDIRRGKELGVLDYIVKARISLDDLVKKVHTALTPVG